MNYSAEQDGRGRAFFARAARATGRVLDLLIDAMAVVAALLLVMLAAVTFASVLTRYFLRMPLAWSLEITEFALLYITFLGAPWVLRRRGHVRIDLVVGRLQERSRQVFHVVATLIGIGVSALLAYYGSLVTYDAYDRGVQMINVLRIPRYLILWVIPFGSLVLLLQLTRMLFHSADADIGSAVPEVELEDG